MTSQEAFEHFAADHDLSKTEHGGYVHDSTKSLWYAWVAGEAFISCAIVSMLTEAVTNDIHQAVKLIQQMHKDMAAAIAKEDDWK